MQPPIKHRVIKSIKNDIFGINFVINNLCNQRCNYCPPVLHKGMFPHIPSETYINFFDNLNKDNPCIQEKPQRKITLTGGEPSFYKGVEDVMVFLRSINFLVAMNTNLGNNLEFWSKAVDLIDILYPSFHPRYANIDHFKKVFDIFLKKKRHIELHVLMDPEYWDLALEASKEFFKMDGITVNNKGVLDVNNYKKHFTPLYNQGQIDFIKHNPSNRKYNFENDRIEVEYFDGRKTPFDGQEILANNFHNFKGILCNAGKNALNIKENGSIWGACCSQRYFGNLQEDPNLRIKLFDSPIICPRDACPHLFDMKIQKSFTRD